MAQFDEDADIAEEAQQQWEEKELALVPSFFIPLFLLLGHKEAKIRACASRAIAAGLLQFPNAVKSVLDHIVKKYNEIAAIEDDKERALFLPTVVMLFYLLEQCALKKAIPQASLFEVLDLLFNLGFAHRSNEVRVESMKAGEAVMESYGADHTQELLKYLNDRLKALEKDADTEEEVRERCACHL